ncbi:MAG: hypothetical protein C5B49_13430 [Bdellovibrio sp.]|nr:MAG: hypothetical protein C5B49_13430 [Bdellovibrio sp.]
MTGAYLLLLGLSFLLLSCSQGGGSSTSPTATGSTLTVTATSPTLTSGATTALTASGGSGVLASVAVSPVGCGVVTLQSAMIAYYTAPSTSAAENCTVTVVDNANNQANVVLTVSPSGSTALTTTSTTTTAAPLSVVASAYSLSPNQQAQITVQNGTEPYTWTVDGGSLQSTQTTTGIDYYTAPATANLYTVTIKDALGSVGSVQFTVSNTAASVSDCSGNYTWVIGASSLNLTLLESTTTGKIIGYFGSSAVQGGCTSTTMTFQVVGTSNVFNGTFYTSSAGKSAVIGSYNGVSSYLAPQ